eukprot:203073-Pelagomonas_calceolata.AAC.3
MHAGDGRHLRHAQQQHQDPCVARYQACSSHPVCRKCMFLCTQVMTGIRAMPNNSTKTPVSLINEYASRMMLEELRVT